MSIQNTYLVGSLAGSLTDSLTGNVNAKTHSRPVGRWFGWAFATLLMWLQGCTTVTIDQARMTKVGQNSQLMEGKSIVVIGRRSGSDYETEPDLVSCIGNVLGKGQQQVAVIPEQEFVDLLYPWFEPRTAPVRVNDLFKLLELQELDKAIKRFNMQYLIWVDGSTQTTSQSGEITCALGMGGVSCFGFGTWDKKAEYEATIWDYHQRKLVGKVSGSADGTSYMPAIVIPIPIIAPVQNDVCQGIGVQLRSFFNIDPLPVAPAVPGAPTAQPDPEATRQGADSAI